MPSPSTSLTTLRPDLGGSLQEFDLAMDRQGFIGMRVLPVIESAMQSGTYGVIPIESLLQNKDTTRASGGNYSRDSFTFEEGSFATIERGHEAVVDDRNSRIYANYFDAEVISAQRALDFVMRGYERRVAAAVFNAVTWTATSVGTEWSTIATATPITDVATAAQTMWETCGLWPNALIINREVFNNLRRCAEILDLVKYVEGTLPGNINTAHLATAFDLPNIIVSGSAQNTANEAAALSISPVWSSEYAAVARIAETNSIEEPCLGRTIHWSADGSTVGTTMESYRDETRRSDIVRSRMETAEKIIYTPCLELLDNITA